MAGWTTLENLVSAEREQRMQEGCNLEGFNERFNNFKKDEATLMGFYNELMALPVVDSFDCPNELDKIKELRPNGPRKLNITNDEKELQDKFYGAWLGRCIGCALGKPIENGDFMAGSNGRAGWENVKLWFEGANAYPISNYTPKHSTAEEKYNIRLTIEGYKSTLENIAFMETDDDIRYTVLGLKMLEENGLDWDSWNLGKFWLSNLTYKQVCTAETQAYLNLAQITNYFENKKPDDWNEKAEWVRTYLNPYREWIGAQIRVDGYAYSCAGNPELAAELAWRDSSFSHVKNGIYGAMFISSMISAAFVETDMKKIVEIGLSEIPANCKLACEIKKAIEITENTKDELDLVEKIWNEFKHYSPVHTINNAALCVAALLFGKNDFDKTIAISVLGGWDTDCNGASVGSIIGAVLGAKAIPEKWKSPLNDTLYSAIPDFHPIAISECAKRSYDVYKKIK
jgi:ADP-ribosylglycohydrolase